MRSRARPPASWALARPYLRCASGALSARCIGKELMQCTPNVTAMMEDEDPAVRDRAKRVTLEANLSLLHDLCLTQFFRATPRIHTEDSRCNVGARTLLPPCRPGDHSSQVQLGGRYEHHRGANQPQVDAPLDGQRLHHQPAAARP